MIPTKLEKYIMPVPFSGCWIWMGSLTTNGYAQRSWENRATTIHRFIFECVHGKIDDGLELDHLCRIRCCVNPDHLEPVTHLENMRRSKAFRVWKTHCVRGHSFSDDNLLMIDGNQCCRACNRIRTAKWKAQKRGAS